MAWRMSSVEDQRKAFIAICLEGKHTMADICRMYNISRQTGYKWLNRKIDGDEDCLKDRSRTPLSQPNKTEQELVDDILAVRHCFPKWGPRKVFAWLKRTRPEVAWPSTTTIGLLFNKNGLTVSRNIRRRVPGKTAPLAHCQQPNDVWCVDFKGWFLTLDGSKCEPFTLTDGASRFLLRCLRLNRNDTNHVWGAMDSAFREFGLPYYMRSDNGPPFASCGVGRFSELSIRLIKAGVTPEWIDPGKPQQNGRHERMHQTLKSETAMPPEETLEMQAEKHQNFQEYYNFIRPHEALGQETPGSVYVASEREWDGVLRSPEYGREYTVRGVRQNGSIRWKGEEIYIGKTLSGEPIGLKEIEDGRHEVRYGPIILGAIDMNNGFMIPPGNKRKRRKVSIIEDG